MTSEHQTTEPILSGARPKNDRSGIASCFDGREMNFKPI